MKIQLTARKIAFIEQAAQGSLLIKKREAVELQLPVVAWRVVVGVERMRNDAIWDAWRTDQTCHRTLGVYM